MDIKPFFTEFRFTLPLRNVLYVSLIVGLYSVVPILLQYFKTFETVEKISTGLETMLGLVLSLLLVFRANRAYERWWEARSNWGILVNVSRNLAIKVKTFIQPNREEARYFHSLISDFSIALLYHLRGADGRDKLSQSIPIPDTIQHVPLYLTQLLYEAIEAKQDQGVIDDVQFLNIDTDLSQFMHVAGACEKIKNSLVSLSYRSFVHHIMIVLFLFLPWQLVHTYQAWTIPLVVLIAYISFALEGIARNLEEPFGTTSDDVHMEQISEGIIRSTGQVLCGAD
jgi:ion channel-forming bestrophin family protein